MIYYLKILKDLIFFSNFILILFGTTSEKIWNLRERKKYKNKEDSLV